MGVDSVDTFLGESFVEGLGLYGLARVAYILLTTICSRGREGKQRVLKNFGEKRCLQCLHRSNAYLTRGFTVENVDNVGVYM